MEVRHLPLEPLTEAAFAPFGEVIEVSDRAEQRIINYGNTVRYHDLAMIDVRAQGGRPIVSIFRSTPLVLPLQLTVMERHPLSSQMFMPLSGAPYLVVVSYPGPFDLSGLRVFHATPRQGVNIARGTWHHFNLALKVVSDFLVIEREGPGENLDEVTLPTTPAIFVDAPPMDQAG